MIHQKSVKELGMILKNFKQLLAQYDQEPKRNKEEDYKLIPHEDLKCILNSEIREQDKKKILLSQIGLIRINIFAEIHERLQILEQENKLDEAVELMNYYASNVAIPFIPRNKSPSLMHRFMDLFVIRRELEPSEYIQKWKNEYRAWIRNKMIPSDRYEQYSQLKTAFRMIYAMSFSDENFPPAPIVIFSDSFHVKI